MKPHENVNDIKDIRDWSDNYEENFNCYSNINAHFILNYWQIKEERIHKQRN